jgi:hypothetical protein
MRAFGNFSLAKVLSERELAQAEASVRLWVVLYFAMSTGRARARTGDSVR